VNTLTKAPGTGAYSTELESTAAAVRVARSYVVDVLTAWAVPEDVIDTARLLASELATNAITHGETGRIYLEVRSFGCCLGVDVRDDSPAAPVVRSVAGDDERGRGLLLVAELADSWGYYFAGGCKHVWFHLHIVDS
jgi:anti-sigma regulatory factor (Ser/Thr protein kinase)